MTGVAEPEDEPESLPLLPDEEEPLPVPEVALALVAAVAPPDDEDDALPGSFTEQAARVTSTATTRMDFMENLEPAQSCVYMLS